MDLFRETFYKLKNNSILVNIFFDEFNDDIIGYINSISDDLISFLIVDDYGRMDGLVITYLRDISRIRWHSRSLKVLSKIIQGNPHDLSINLKTSTIFDLITSIDKNQLVALYYQETDPSKCYIGTINSFDADSILLDEVGTTSEISRSKLLLPLETITRVDLRSQYLIFLKDIYLE